MAVSTVVVLAVVVLIVKQDGTVIISFALQQRTSLINRGLSIISPTFLFSRRLVPCISTGAAAAAAAV